GNNIIVTTHMSNLGFDETINELGGTVVRTDIGDKYVLKKMLDLNSWLGGEQSGHIVFLFHSPNGDGIITTFQLLDALNKHKERISVQANRMKKYYQKLINYQISNKKDLLQDAAFHKMSEEIQNNLQKDGRVLVRFSGTENKVRILLESKEERNIQQCQKIIEDFFNKFTKLKENNP
ncbi:MAG TPA: phosphoglucosamine mutase, partial [Atribacterota bacterium]|nr:phosphoglucosamine mutase [Atribacterota bacterium]